MGSFVLATEKLSRRLCPGTPSNVFFFRAVSVSVSSPSASFALVSEPFLGVPGLALPFMFPPCPTLLDSGPDIDIRFFPGGVAGCSSPNRNAAALVNLGAIAGGAVDATVIVSVRLCPGTPAKVFLARSFSLSLSTSFSSSLRGKGIRPVLANDMRVLVSGRGEPSAERPCRRSAALVRRGAISGLRCVFGSGRARNWALPDEEVDPARLRGVLENPGPRASEEPGEGESA